ncbi:MAG TPA: aminoglycoside phosphotransferase family protein [Caulobacteraceae bacterium]|nr:aminoglycoside phosphotransferase family protein [Caulobacteraceae bacterium]
MKPETSRFDARDIDPSLVRSLVADQFPAWAGLAVRAAEPQGHDNRTFRLGEHMAVRLPSHAGYVAQIAKEQTWLPRLAPQLPLPIPTPIAAGVPGCGYPWPWSVYRWLEGRAARKDRIRNLAQFARDVAGFLAALRRIDPVGGPPAGPHSFGRGGPLATYDGQTREAIAKLGDAIDGGAAAEVWDAALAAPATGAPVWFHGDIAVNNLLLDERGRLAAVIDFGCSGVGDPACDLVLAWTLLDGDDRAAFQAAVGLDPGAWARARGWALWKALIVCAAGRGRADGEGSLRVIEAVVAEHRSAA